MKEQNTCYSDHNSVNFLPQIKLFKTIRSNKNFLKQLANITFKRNGCEKRGREMAALSGIRTPS